MSHSLCSRTHLAILAGSIAGLIISSVNGSQAATYSWQTGGATNIWSTDPADANWFIDANTVLSPWENASHVSLFNPTTDLTVTVAGVVAPSEIRFAAGWANNFIVADGTIDFGAGGGLIDSSLVTTAGARQIAINSAITGTGGLVLNAHGDLSATGGGNGARLVLGGNNSGLTGGVSIIGGLVQASTSNAFGANDIFLSGGGGFIDANSNITLGNKINVDLNGGGTIRLFGNATTNLDGLLTGSGGLRRTDGGTLNFNGDLSGYSGAYTNEAGTTRFTSNASLTGAVFINGGAVMVGGDSTTTGSLHAASSISIGNAGALRVRRNGSYAASSVLPDSINLGGADATLEVNPSDAAAVIDWDQDLGVDASIGHFRASGGTVNLTAGTDLTVNRLSIGLQSNTNRGTLNVLEGSNITTRFFDIGSAGNNSGTVNQSGGTVSVVPGSNGFRIGHWTNGTAPANAYNLTAGTLDTTQVLSTISWDGAGTMTVGGGATTATWRVGQLNFDGGGGDNMTGKLIVGANGVVEVNGGIGASNHVGEGVFLTGGTMRPTMDGTWNAAIDAAASTTSTIAMNGLNVTITNNVTGTGNLNLDGAGTVKFDTGANTRTVSAGLDGTASIQKLGAGVLNLTGSGDYSGVMTASAGTLNVGGTYFGSTVSLSDATLGGEGIVGNLTLTGATSTALNVNAATSGALTATTGLSVGGTITINLVAGPTTSGPITLLNYGGSLMGNIDGFVLPNADKYRSAIFATQPQSITLDIGSKQVVWSGGTTWDVKTSQTWNDGADVFAWGDRVVFNDTGSTTAVALTGDLQPSSVLVDSNTNQYTITGGTGNQIGGSATLTKNGTSTLTLATSQAYTGGTTVNAGVLNLTGGGGSGGTIRGTATVNAGGVLRLAASDVTGYGTGTDRLSVINLNGGSMEVNTTANQTVNAAITMTGGKITTTPGFVGTTNIDLFNNGTSITTLASTTPSEISTTTINLRQNDTQFNIADGAAAADLLITSNVGDGSGGNHNLVKNGAGTMVLSGTNTYTGATNINAGVLQIGSSGATGQIGRGAVAIGTSGTLAYNRTGAYTQVGALNGTGRLSIDGGVALTLNAGGSFSGTVDVLNGALVFGVTNPTGAHASSPTINLSPGTTLTNLGASAHGHVGTVRMNAATWTTGSGTGSYDGENYQLNGDVIVTGSAPSSIQREASRTNANSGIALNGQRTFDVADVTTSSASDLVVSTELEARDLGVVGGITKSGAGTLELVAGVSHSFAGETIVNAGTLLVNGSLAGSAIVNDGTLAGLGTLGATVVNADGDLSPGALAIGTLNFNSTLALGGTTSLEINKTGLSLSSDLVNVSGLLTLGGTLNVAASGDSLGFGDVFNLFDAASFEGGFTAFNLPALDTGLVWDVQDLDSTGSIAVVPEPSALVSLLGGMGMLLGLRRRKR